MSGAVDTAAARTELERLTLEAEALTDQARSEVVARIVSTGTDLAQRSTDLRRPSALRKLTAADLAGTVVFTAN